MLLAAVIGIIYLTSRFHRFSFMQKLAEKHRAVSWILSALAIAVIGGCWAFINVWSVIIVLIHLFIFWLGCDIVSAFITRITKKKPRKNYAGAAAIAITAVYLGIGWFLAHHVSVTQYSFYTNKDIGTDTLRIVEVADSHLGITLDGEKFAAQMERVSKTEPDVVLICGDFVDDDSSREDMIRSCEALGQLKTRFGVYFVFGNHDKGYYQGYRDFTSDELREKLEENGVIILEDESVLVNDSFYIIGRQDRSEENHSPGRADMNSLTQELDGSKYAIVMDHQPNAYDEEAASGVDTVLSGHTHGGHIFPAGQIGLLIKANDRVYGTEQRGNTTFVVTSGISGWAIPFKTGTFSEFVIIDIHHAD